MTRPWWRCSGLSCAVAAGLALGGCPDDLPELRDPVDGAAFEGLITPPDTTVVDAPPISCGDNARETATGCECLPGYVNTDNDWSDGCEDLDPDCAPMSCDKCPEGYCGDDARCTDWGKCRCTTYYINTDDDWSNGCETHSPDCAHDNCNKCYTGFCGPKADCMQNNCECVVAGWANCDGEWELNGCECNGTCVAGQCQ